jgi:hypothetical protein
MQIIEGGLNVPQFGVSDVPDGSGRRNRSGRRRVLGTPTGFNTRDVGSDIAEPSTGSVFHAPVLSRKSSGFGHLNAKSLNGVRGKVRFHEQSIL